MKRGLQFKGPQKQGGWIQYVGLALGGMSLIQGRNAAKAQKQANIAQRNINRRQNAQNKRAFLRNVRQAQANALVGTVAAGVGLESSRAQGERQSNVTQTEVGMYDFNRMGALGGTLTAALNAASRYQYQSALFSTASQFAMSFYGARPTTTDTTPSYQGVPQQTKLENPPPTKLWTGEDG